MDSHRLISRLSIAALVIATACAPESPKSEKLKPWEPAPEKVKDDNPSRAMSVNPRVDILFVVDDSGSMDSKQKNLAGNLEQFTRGIERARIIDYHIGVISTTKEKPWGDEKRSAWGGRLWGEPRFIDRSTDYMSIRLKKNLILGTSGSGSEKFFDPVHLALTEPLMSEHNKGFYRPDAFLVLVFITDTDDQSDEMDVVSFTNFLWELKEGDRDKVIAYSAYIPTRVAEKDCSRSGEERPEKLEQFFKLVINSTFSVCDKGFGRRLAQLAEDLVRRVTSIKLKKAPDPKSIVVKYGGEPMANDARVGWTYDPDLNSIIFGSEIDWAALPKDGKVEITFNEAKYEDRIRRGK